MKKILPVFELLINPETEGHEEVSQVALVPNPAIGINFLKFNQIKMKDNISPDRIKVTLEKIDRLASTITKPVINKPEKTGLEIYKETVRGKFISCMSKIAEKKRVENIPENKINGQLKDGSNIYAPDLVKGAAATDYATGVPIQPGLYQLPSGYNVTIGNSGIIQLVEKIKGEPKKF